MTNAGTYITWDIEDSEFEIPEYSIDEGDPWSWFEEISKYDQYLLYFDKDNKLHYKKHPMFLDTPPPSIFDFNEDTMTKIVGKKLDAHQVSQVSALGFHGYTTFTTLFPPTPVETGGRLEEIKGVPVLTQEDLDTIARRVYIFKNSKWAASVTDVRNHHLGIGDIVTVTYVDEPNDISWDYGKRFYVNSLGFDMSMDNGQPKLQSDYELIEIPSQIYFNAG
jgi:hypothetical protein